MKIEKLRAYKTSPTEDESKKISNIIIWANHLDVSIEITARGYRFISDIKTDNGITTWKKFADWVRLSTPERALLVKAADLFDVDLYQK